MPEAVKIINLISRLSLKFPSLKKELLMARIKMQPSEFLQKSIRDAAIFSVVLTFFSFFILDKAKKSKILLIPALIIFFFLVFRFSFLKIRASISKRAREIDREVLFVGRYLLVKLYSGRPLLNALMETSSGRGVAAKYIKEIVDDIETGNPIEKALEDATEYSPSEKLKKVLFQVNNALKLGIDVTKPLESVIHDISVEQELDVKKYGKKLNSVVIFYMLMAVVIPSIGMTMFIVVSSFINFSISFRVFLMVLFLIVMIQLVFISVFRAIRPNVNI
ncbi:type II secretion system F family protein [Candidatus Woesearchaeota archaeon]|nr:type II secretion system F family protein [Candidatus Woesearchaeota archaeon]